jgi:hypothetical protein
MRANALNIQAPSLYADAGRCVRREGADFIVSRLMTKEAFLAGENARMAALVRLYLDRSADGLPPKVDQVQAEDLFSVGMLNHTHCLRVDADPDNIQFTVWAPAANFDQRRSLQNAKLSELQPYGMLMDLLKMQILGTLVHGRPTFHEMKGLLKHQCYYFSKAILPLRSEEGEIVKCLVPFSDKLSDIPSHLRQEFCTADIEQE